MKHKCIALFKYWIGLKDIEKHQLFQKVKSEEVDFIISVNKVYRDTTVAYLLIDISDNKKDAFFQFTINSAGGYGVVGFPFETIHEESKFLESYIETLIDFCDLGSQFQSPISVIEAESIPPNSNPYNHDRDRQGISLGSHWELMFTTSGRRGLDNVRFVNLRTGRIFDLDLYDAEKFKGE